MDLPGSINIWTSSVLPPQYRVYCLSVPARGRSTILTQSLLLHLHDWTIFHSSLFYPSASTFLNNVATNGKLFGFHPPTTIDSLPASLSKPMKFNSNLSTILGTSLNYIRRQIVFKRIWHTFEVNNYQRIPSLKMYVRDPIGYRGAEPTTNNCT